MFQVSNWKDSSWYSSWSVYQKWAIVMQMSVLMYRKRLFGTLIILRLNFDGIDHLMLVSFFVSFYGKWNGIGFHKSSHARNVSFNWIKLKKKKKIFYTKTIFKLKFHFHAFFFSPRNEIISFWASLWSQWNFKIWLEVEAVVDINPIFGSKINISVAEILSNHSKNSLNV